MLESSRNISFRSDFFHEIELGVARRAAPRCRSWDVRFCWRLPWRCLEPWLLESQGSGQQIFHSLLVQPSPSLSPLEVVTAQAYALHCGRVDVCFRFASPLNKLMTGPLERFLRLFEAPSRTWVKHRPSRGSEAIR